LVARSVCNVVTVSIFDIKTVTTIFYISITTPHSVYREIFSRAKYSRSY